MIASSEPVRAENPAPCILLAEDETMLRMVMADTLRDAGYEISEAKDGADALAVLESGAAIDLLIADIRMPRMDGYQLTIRALERNPQLKVLLVTGYASEPLPERLRALKVPVLHKPFDFDKLVEIVKSLLDSRERIS